MNRPSTIAIVGRPNVGKSTLFNRIVGGRPAIVDDRPGVTRDRNFGRGHWAGRDFWVVDTGGWLPGDDEPLNAAIRRQVEQAVAAADAIFFMVDVRDGIHPADQEVASLLRSCADRVILVANKADEPATEVGHHVFHALGLGDPIPVSAGSGRGSGDLLDLLVTRMPASALPDADAIQVAVVGRPNVGKSSIMNRLLGEERSVVAAEAGTTRDAVDAPLRYHGVTLNFIDTAGLRKRSKVEDEVEFYSTLRTQLAIERADVCVLVVDAADGLHTQDLKVASAAWERGTGLIVAVNKWDLVEKDQHTAEQGRADVVARAPFLGAAPFQYVSALTGQRVQNLLELVVQVAAERTRRVATAEVNRVIEALVARQQPPQAVGQEVKLLYGSQVGTAPPLFALVASRPEAIPVSYERYLVNGFREAWGFVGVPIRLKFKRRRRKERV